MVLAGCGSSSAGQHGVRCTVTARRNGERNASRCRSPTTDRLALADASTEDLFAIGAGPQVVAVDSVLDLPGRAPRTKPVGLSPNVEAIADYHPDLVS